MEVSRDEPTIKGEIGIGLNGQQPGIKRYTLLWFSGEVPNLKGRTEL